MFSHQIQKLLQLSKTSTQTLQILHCLLLKTSLDHNEYFFSQLIDSATSASLRHARQLFDSSPISPPPLYAWNMLIKAYSKSSSTPVEAVNLFAELLRTPDALKPDQFAYPFVIKSCGRCLMLGVGGSVHSLAMKEGFGSESHVRNSLLTMYGVCGAIKFARKLFDEMSERNVVTWSSMIAAYVDCNLDLEALRVFKEMETSNEKPNSITFVSLLSACTNLLNTRLGKSIHSHIIINAIKLHVGLRTALLSLYAKSGHLDEALQIFNSITDKNLQSWNVMISSLAHNGCGEEALSLFSRMEESGLRPDSLSFSTILSACSHRGLLDKGRELFDKMVNVYNIKPTVEHFGCMVDLFGRCGMVEEAYQIIVSMPMEPNAVILRSYLSASKQHGAAAYLANEHLMDLLIKLEPDNGSNYVLAASISSRAGYWSDVENMRSEMKLKGVKKVAGCSWAES